MVRLVDPAVPARRPPEQTSLDGVPSGRGRSTRHMPTTARARYRLPRTGHPPDTRPVPRDESTSPGHGSHLGGPVLPRWPPRTRQQHRDRRHRARRRTRPARTARSHGCPRHKSAENLHTRASDRPHSPRTASGASQRSRNDFTPVMSSRARSARDDDFSSVSHERSPECSRRGRTASSGS